MTKTRAKTDQRRLLRGVSRDTRDAVLEAAERGWTYRLTAKGHVQLRHPSGAIVVTAGSTGDRRSLQHLRADLARVEKAAS